MASKYVAKRLANFCEQQCKTLDKMLRSDTDVLRSLTSMAYYQPIIDPSFTLMYMSMIRAECAAFASTREELDATRCCLQLWRGLYVL